MIFWRISIIRILKFQITLICFLKRIAIILKTDFRLNLFIPKKTSSPIQNLISSLHKLLPPHKTSLQLESKLPNVRMLILIIRSFIPKTTIIHGKILIKKIRKTAILSRRQKTRTYCTLVKA